MSSKASRSSALGNNTDKVTNPMFQRAVERVANFKCAQAIRAGKLRLVQEPNPALPVRFTPRMDLLDDPTTNTRIAIFELPGIKVSDVTLQIQRGSLVIAGERRPPQAVQKALDLGSARTSLARNPVAAADSIALGDMVDDSDSNPAPSLALHELRFGQFGRAIPVPEGIKESDVTAKLQDGMLTVTWPKNPTKRSVQSVTPPVSPIPARCGADAHLSLY